MRWCLEQLNRFSVYAEVAQGQIKSTDMCIDCSKGVVRQQRMLDLQECSNFVSFTAG